MTILVLIRMFQDMFHERSLKWVPLLLLGNFVIGFRLELMWISLIIITWSIIIHYPWISALCAAVVAHRNHFFCLYQQNILLNLKQSSFKLVSIAKGFLKLPKLPMLMTQKSLSRPRNLALATFRKLLIVFSTKINLLYLFYSMPQRCFLLHMIKHNYLLKTFPLTLILMTQVYFFPFSFLELIWKCIILL